MAKDRKSDDSKSEEAGAPLWMVTYSDMVTLLLTFFILLFSMATIDKQKFIEIANALKSSLLNNASGERLDSNKGKNLVKILEYNEIDYMDKTVNNDKKQKSKEEILEAAEELKKQDLEEQKDKIAEQIKELKLEEYVDVVLIDEEFRTELIIRLNNKVLFEPGSAEINTAGKETLKKIQPLLLGGIIEVQGHTDNVPINTTLFPSNWELSTKRASNVVKYYLDNFEEMDPQNFSATGFGEYRPIETNETDTGRQQNRRIDIVLPEIIN
jgi:chemotaxis protein MotB